MLRDFFLGMMKIHILYHASQEQVYGAAMMEELGHHGYEISPGTLYPMLHRQSWIGKGRTAYQYSAGSGWQGAPLLHHYGRRERGIERSAREGTRTGA